MRKISALLLISAFAAFVAAQPVAAEEWRGHDEWREHGDIHHFHEHDYDHWRGGYWHHGFHDGRGGWWWIVGGGWYFYPAPVYPYPDPYTPPEFIIETAPAAPVAAPVAAPPTVTYYCPNPAGYYPYVARCYGAWEKIITTTNEPVPMQQPALISPPALAQPPMLSAPDNQREIDDRQLNAFAVEFQNINLHDKYARAALKDLLERIQTYHQALFQRNYNAMDILKDAEGLEHRIADQRARLGQ